MRAAAKRRLLIVVGTRPEAIKLAPVVHALADHSELFDIRVCATGQHREMLDQALAFLEIKPDYDLNIMAPNQGPDDVVAGILTGMKSLLREDAPDLVMVQGDTSTAFAAALLVLILAVRPFGVLAS